MSPFRSVVLILGLLACVLPAAALAEPLSPTYYLPTAAEQPAGWEIASRSPVDTTGDLSSQSEVAVIPGATTPESIFHAVIVGPSATYASLFMTSRHIDFLKLGGAESYAFRASDESYAVTQRGVERDRFRFGVRFGSVTAETILTGIPNSVTETNAAAIARIVMAPMLTRMQQHPNAV